MKISFLILTAHGMGGTVRSTVTLANYLAGRGHHVELISMYQHRDDTHFAIDPRIRLRTVTDTRKNRRKGPVEAVLSRFRSRAIPSSEAASKDGSLWTDYRLRRMLYPIRSDVVVGTRPAMNIVVARFVPKRAVRIGQEHLHFGAHHQYLYQHLERFYPALDAFSTLTDGDRADYERLFHGASTQVYTIGNAIPDTPRPLSPQSDKVILALGRMVAVKGYERLVEAFAKVSSERPDWRLRFVGDGNQQGMLKRMAAELGIAEMVEFPGRTRDVEGELARSSIHAVSSRFEGFGMTIIEAFASGVPVVSFDCPRGPRQLITDGHDGLRVPEGDVEGLARALVRLVDDDELRRAMAANAVETAKRYSIATIGARWEEIFADLEARKRDS